MSDRRELKREYRDTPRTAGVYRVLNTANGRCLLGAAADAPGKLNGQRFQLELGSHPNKELQRDYDDAGVAAFEFEVLDTLEPGDATPAELAEDLEQLRLIWLDRLELSDESLYAKAKAHPDR